MRGAREQLRAERPARRLGACVGLLVLLLNGGGCSGGGPDYALRDQMARGEFGYARGRAVAQRGSGRELLPLLNLGMANLADGLAPESEAVFGEVYEILRMRDVNAGSRLASRVMYEGVTYFKGEPFEQALAYCAVAVQRASIGDFDNCRAAAISSLDLLDEYDAFRGRSPAPPSGFAYAVQRNGFALGYALAGIGAFGMGRGEEAEDYLRRAAEINPDLGDISGALRQGANTIFIVDAGLGPVKDDVGGAAVFLARTPGDDRRIEARVSHGTGGRYAQALDVNLLSRRYSWDELRTARGVKRAVGEGLVIGGAVVASTSDDDEAKLAGLAMILAGALTQISSSADLRQVDTFAQRTYIVPVSVEGPGTSVELEVLGGRGSGVTLVGLSPPRGALQVRYVRLPMGEARWAREGRLLYHPDGIDEPVPGDDLPYILGGRDVRTPSHDVLADYQRAGNLAGLTLADLMEMYRAEGIRVGTDGAGGRIGRHVLEGGTWLFTPQAGTVGHTRLFTRPAPPYRPRSALVRDWIATHPRRADE